LGGGYRFSEWLSWNASQRTRTAFRRTVRDDILDKAAQTAAAEAISRENEMMEEQYDGGYIQGDFERTGRRGAR
jgi:hypothetical protein